MILVILVLIILIGIVSIFLLKRPTLIKDEEGKLNANDFEIIELKEFE